MKGGPAVVSLSGGVGGAKLVCGLAQLLPEDDLTIVANTGDDFDHLGLRVCPDIDTIIYTLSDLADPERGWGRRDETWHFLEAMGALGGETWFQLGDRDLAVHVERTRRLREGASLSTVTNDIARRLGVRHEVVPMSDQDVRTIVCTEARELSFQRYFVRERCRPRVRTLRYDGAADASMSVAFAAALASNRLGLIVISPSNPFLSIDPILSLPGAVACLKESAAPVVAVSPIIAGAAVKGPTAKIMEELGLAPGVQAIARHYGGIIDGLVVDERDRQAAVDIERELGIRCFVCDTLMTSNAERMALAENVLSFARRRTDGA